MSYPEFSAIKEMKVFASKKLHEPQATIRTLATKRVHMLAARVEHHYQDKEVSLPENEFNADLPLNLKPKVIEDMKLLIEKLCPAYKLTDDGLKLYW